MDLTVLLHSADLQWLCMQVTGRVCATSTLLCTWTAQRSAYRPWFL